MLIWKIFNKMLKNDSILSNMLLWSFLQIPYCSNTFVWESQQEQPQTSMKATALAIRAVDAVI